MILNCAPGDPSAGSGQADDDDVSPDDDTALDDDTTPDDDASPDDDDDDNDFPEPVVTWADCAGYFTAAERIYLPARLVCGTVNAPWNYDAVDDESIDVRFAVLPASGDSHGVLAVHLGGPDPNIRNLIILGISPDGLLNRELHENFDLLFVEVRGSLKSTTPLVCPPEIFGASYDGPEQFRALVRQCLEATAAAYDPARMTTIDSVRDLDRVRQALGVETMRLYGSSYGGKVMLEYLRRYEQRVVAYLLDSPLTPQMSGKHDFDRVLRTLAEDCALDADCPVAPEQIRPATEQLLAQLEDNPPLLGPTALGVTDDLFHLGYWPDLLVYWPGLLVDALGGNLFGLRTWHLGVQLLLPPRHDLPTETDTFAYDPYSDNTMCIDFPGWNVQDGDDFVLRRLSPPYVSLDQLSWMCQISCDELAAVYQTEPAVDRTPVESDVPGLIVAPRFDEDTPWTDITAAVDDGLTGAYLLPVLADHAVLLYLDNWWLGMGRGNRRCLRNLVRDWLIKPFDPALRPCNAALTAPLDF